MTEIPKISSTNSAPPSLTQKKRSIYQLNEIKGQIKSLKSVSTKLRTMALIGMAITVGLISGGLACVAIPNLTAGIIVATALITGGIVVSCLAKYLRKQIKQTDAALSDLKKHTKQQKSQEQKMKLQALENESTASMMNDDKEQADSTNKKPTS